MSKNYTFENRLYKVTIKNALLIILLTCSLSFLFIRIISLLSYFIDINLALPERQDLITIYIGVLGMLLPLILLLIETVGNKKDYIESTVYLKETKMFPILVFLCTSLVEFVFIDNQCYFAVVCIFAVILMIYMYYKSFKLLSDYRYETKILKEIRKQEIKEDIDAQIKQYSKEDAINKYEKYGIYINLYLLNTKGYNRFSIKPKKHLQIINGYNTQLLDRIANELKELNKGYIKHQTKNTNEIDVKNQKNIFIRLLRIGTTLESNESCLTIYYKDESHLKRIQRYLSEKIYITSENNTHYYFASNFDSFLQDCMNAIDINSPKLLNNSLKRYREIYEDYIDYFRKIAGDYTYKEAYEHTHAFERARIYDLFNTVTDIIYDCAKSIKKSDNEYLMNELVSFLYSLILYSYGNNELLSIQYLYNIYFYLNGISFEMSGYDRIYKKIKSEIFEFANIVKSNISEYNVEFYKNILLVINKTNGSIINYLHKKDNEKFKEYLKETFKFIGDVRCKLEDYGEINKELDEYKAYKEAYENYSCNIFVILSYIIQRLIKHNSNYDDLLDYYNSYTVEELTDIYLWSCEKDYNDSTYWWSALDEEHEGGEVFTVKTGDYITYLYCLLLNRKNNVGELPLSYELSTHSKDLVKNFEEFKNKKLVKKVEKLTEGIETQRKVKLREIHISQDKIDQFKSKFINLYKQNATIYNLFKETNNIELVNNNEIKKKSNVIGINYICDKTYFLDKQPFNENIMWVDFEENFVDAFINNEEYKFAKQLEKHITHNKKDNILDYLKNIENKKEFVIISSYKALINFISYKNICYKLPNDAGYEGIISDNYVVIDNEYIPVFRVDELGNDSIYLISRAELGTLKKSKDEFCFDIQEFNSNEKLLEKTMNEDINGINLTGEEKQNHLLEKARIKISEYVIFDISNIEAIKFYH